MRNFSFLYEFFKPIVFLAVRVFYRKVQFKNIANFPAKGPVLICCSHTNAFMDPIVFQTRFLRSVYSLARGDVFKNKIMAWVFNQFKIMPIFRISEGAENLYKNEESFSRSYNVLERGFPLIIFPEGICVQEKRLRKLKKGAARIALGVEERNGFNFNLAILPVCINYSHPSKFRSTAFLYLNKPIYTGAYVELYKTDKAKAIKLLTQDIEHAMAQVYVHINNKNLDEFVEQVFDIYKPEFFARNRADKTNLEANFELDKLIISAINVQDEKNRIAIEKLKEKVGLYDYKIKAKYKLRHHLFTASKLKSLSFFNVFIQFIGILIGFPFFVFGLITNYIPYKLAYSQAQKLLKKNIEFYASVNLVIGIFAWLFYFVIQLVLLKHYFNDTTLLLLASITIPALGMYAINYYWFLRKFIGSTRLFFLRLKQQSQFEILLKERKEIIDELDGIMV